MSEYMNIQNVGLHEYPHTWRKKLGSILEMCTSKPLITVRYKSMSIFACAKRIYGLHAYMKTEENIQTHTNARTHTSWGTKFFVATQIDKTLILHILTRKLARARAHTHTHTHAHAHTHTYTYTLHRIICPHRSQQDADPANVWRQQTRQ